MPNFLKRLVPVIVALRNLNMNFGVRLAFDKGQATGPFVCGRENITQKDGTTAGPFGNGEKGSWEDFFSNEEVETGDTRKWCVDHGSLTDGQTLLCGKRDEKREGYWLGEVCIYFPKLAMNATTGCSYVYEWS